MFNSLQTPLPDQVQITRLAVKKGIRYRSDQIPGKSVIKISLTCLQVPEQARQNDIGHNALILGGAAGDPVELLDSHLQ
jgi:hypothetical protein